MKKTTREISVCVIGAGVCGIASVKACLDAGLNVSCYDKSPKLGGLWNYHDEKKNPSNPFIPTVMKTTILNTSKEMSAFSDFPPSANLPNFMKHDLYMDYIKSYVDYFNLMPNIHLRHEILNCEPRLNLETNLVEWLVDIIDIENDNKILKKKFDKLMVAVGHHNIPFMPTFPEQHKFKGQIIHSAKVKDILNDDRFVDKKVLVIGFGNSACDAANDIGLVAKKCYVSSHRGNWFLGRLATGKQALYDFEQRNRFSYYKEKYVPSLHDKSIIKTAKGRINHEFLGLTPKHKPSELTPAINDLFPFRIFTGAISLKSSVTRFTDNGVIFNGEEDEECNVDIVVLATGYTNRFSFLNEFELNLKSAENDEYELYLNMFAPKLRLPNQVQDHTLIEAVNSLAIIGHIQPAGSITVASELQARMATLVFEGKHSLPCIEDMIKIIEKKQKYRLLPIRSHSKDQLVGNWIGFLDEIATEINVKPNLSKLFFKDFPLWKKIMFGPSVSYQYRLTGPGQWDKARETIMTVDERVYAGINDGKNHILFKVRQKRLVDNLNRGKN